MELIMTIRTLVLSAIVAATADGAAAQIPPGMKVGLVEYLQGGYEGLKSTVTSTAERMPDAEFGFRPTSQQHVRTFGQVIAHIAASQFSTCANLRDVANPVAGRDLEKEASSKTAALKALEESFALCDNAVGALSDATASDFVRVGRGHAARAAVIAGLLAHTSEMYGISTVYLRARNIVPPASER
jgi:hypothetical protein